MKGLEAIRTEGKALALTHERKRKLLARAFIAALSAAYAEGGNQGTVTKKYSVLRLRRAGKLFGFGQEVEEWLVRLKLVKR